MKITAVIMAGGKGERFWPKSRSNMPKQFLSLTADGCTMIQLTAHRLLPLVSYEDMFIVTNKDYMELVKEQLPDIPEENILAEPLSRNTAPCIGFAVAVISQKYEDTVMLVLPSDHLVKFEELYVDTLTQAVEAAKEDNNLVTVGITPTYPETGYGYINFGKAETHHGIYVVKKFVEKPDIHKAKEYLASGQYLWNSGMFAWKLSTILKKFETLLPDIHQGIIKIGQAYNTKQYEQVLEQCFNEFKSVSIDYGIMERSEHIYTILGNFGWDDVGSWLALERVEKSNEHGNIVRGDIITINTKDSIIFGEKKLIAVVGLNDVVIIDTDDALLICAKHSAQNVKKIVDNLKICNRNELI
jgi:mannose-1-phosphate guanylyltransferase